MEGRKRGQRRGQVERELSHQSDQADRARVPTIALVVINTDMASAGWLMSSLSQ